jgi:hypothetical protein
LRELNPDVSAEDADGAVACAEDALFVLLERASLLGNALDGRLAALAADGWRSRTRLRLGQSEGWRSAPGCI